MSGLVPPVKPGPNWCVKGVPGKKRNEPGGCAQWERMPKALYDKAMKRYNKEFAEYEKAKLAALAEEERIAKEKQLAEEQLKQQAKQAEVSALQNQLAQQAVMHAFVPLAQSLAKSFPQTDLPKFKGGARVLFNRFDDPIPAVINGYVFDGEKTRYTIKDNNGNVYDDVKNSELADSPIASDALSNWWQDTVSDSLETGGFVSDYLTRLLNWWRSLFSVSPVVVLSSSVAQSTIPWNRTKSGVWYMGSPEHRKWSKAFFDSLGGYGPLFGLISENEGSSSAYQNYDNQLVTLGPGFGGRGMLGKLASTLGKPDVIPLPDNEKRYSKKLLDTMHEQSWGETWIAKAESEVLREDIARAMFEVFSSFVATYGIPTSYDLATQEFLSHLAWWYPAYLPKGSWPNNTEDAMARGITEFLANARKAGKEPSLQQIKNYLATYRKHGGKGTYDGLVT